MISPSDSSDETTASNMQEPKIVLGPVGTISHGPGPEQISELFTFFANLSPGAAKDYLIEELDYYPNLFSRNLPDESVRDATTSIEQAINNFLPHGYVFESDSDAPMAKGTTEYGIWGEPRALAQRDAITGTLEFVDKGGLGSYFNVGVILDESRDVAIIETGDTELEAVEAAAARLYECGFHGTFTINYGHEALRFAQLDMQIMSEIRSREPALDEGRLRHG